MTIFEWIDKQYALYLLLALAWTTLFSMTIKGGVRGYRNFGILASYILLIALFITRKFDLALNTAVLFGTAGGVLYIFYEFVARLRCSDPESKPKVHISHLIYAQFAWPIMIPEAIEYLMAEFGILKTKNPRPPESDRITKAPSTQ